MSYGAPPPSNPYGGSPYGGAPVPQGTNQKSIWSLVLGIVGLLCCGIFTGIPAIILGNMAKKEISRTGQGGGGMATAGLVLGVIAVIWGIISIILVLSGNFYFELNS